MQSTKPLLIQVLPQLKPRRCGLSDNAISLARELECVYGMESAFVILNSTEPCEIEIPRMYCSPSQLLEACNSLSGNLPSAVLTQLSGYGYSSDGAPVALAQALKQLKEGGRFPMGAYVHELAVEEKRPWKSAFWYAGRQRKAIQNVAQTCDLVVTNTDHHAVWLKRSLHPSNTPVVRIPVSSNIGECDQIVPMDAREPVLTVFGLPRTRGMSYKYLARMEEMVSTLGIQEVVDIGPECDVPPSICKVPVKSMGVLSPSDVADIVSRSMFGFVQHEPFCLAKSGVLAGLCAFGTVPLISEPFAGEFDGLRDGVQLMSPRTWRSLREEGLQRCSTAAWQWYSSHNLRAHAAMYVDLLLPSTGGYSSRTDSGRDKSSVSTT